MVLPPAFQAIVTASLAIWLTAKKGWRVVLNPDNLKLSNTTFRLFQVLLVGLLISSGFHIVNLSAELITSPNAGFKTIVKHGRLIGKQGVWGMFIVVSFQYAYLRHWRPAKFARFFAVFLACLAAYMTLQRYWGLDWVHGFSATLPDHRFAYGVYRSSGFMAHPLTLAFSCMLVVLLSFGLGVLFRQKPEAKWWFSSSLMAFLCLVLTGSRFPIVVTILLLGTYALHALAKAHKIYSVLFLLVLVGVGVWGIGHRSAELLDDSRSWTERVPRLVFWDVHWQMFQDHPVLGVGYTQKKIKATEYYEKMGYESLERKYSAHNIYLQTLADSGIVGLLSIITIFSSLGLVGIQILRKWKSPLLGIIVTSTFLAGMMQNILRDSEFLTALWVSLAICLVIIRESPVARNQIENFEP